MAGSRTRQCADAAAVLEGGRQRDLMLLPCIDRDQFCWKGHGSSRIARQRFGKHVVCLDKVDASIVALDSLCGFDHISQGNVSEAQSSAHNNIVSFIFSSPPCFDVPTPKEAFHSLLRNAPKYGVGGTGALATYGSGEVSLPVSSSDGPQVCSVLIDQQAQVFMSFRSSILRSDSECNAYIDLHGTRGLYVDPVLRNNRRKYVFFIHCMNGKGLLCWRTHVESHVGLFFVYKKDGRFRFICDSRQTNARFHAPPEIQLCSGEGMGRLVVGHTGFCGAGFDLKDYFHPLRIPSDLSSIFALPYLIAGEARLRALVGRELAPSQAVSPCLATFPMGYTWAMWAAQNAHVNIVGSIVRNRLLHDRCEVYELTHGLVCIV